jgi:hypothetical protein
MCSAGFTAGAQPPEGGILRACTGLLPAETRSPRWARGHLAAAVDHDDGAASGVGFDADARRRRRLRRMASVHQATRIASTLPRYSGKPVSSVNHVPTGPL